MKKLILFLAVSLTSLMVQAQSPKMRVLFVDSALNNQISPTYLPQVAISGYFSNLLLKPTTMAGYGITDGVSTSSLTTTLLSYATTASLSAYTPTSRTLTINGVTQDLSANRSFTVVPTYGGSAAQYLRGDGSLATFPTVVGTFTNDAGYLTNTSLINQAAAKTANYTITGTDFVVLKQPVLYLPFDCTSSGITVTLPSATTFNGYKIYLTKSDATANTLTISGLTGDNVISTKGWVKELIAVNNTWIQN